jgi:hypothetical protein
VVLPANLVKLVGLTGKPLDPANVARGFGAVTEWWTDSNGVTQYRITFTW